MVATIRRPSTGPRLVELVSGRDRASAILLYHRRLVRLLGLEPAGDDLTSREQCWLRGRAMVATIQALTYLDAGAVASELLREAGRQRRRAALRRARALVASGEGRKTDGPLTDRPLRPRQRAAGQITRG